MKKLLMLVLVLCLVGIGSVACAKTLVAPPPYTGIIAPLTLPDLAPDFMEFNASVQEQIDLGGNRDLLLLTYRNADNSVAGYILCLREGIENDAPKKVHVVGLTAFYKDTNIEDAYEDSNFFKLGVPSGKLEPVSDVSPLEPVIAKLRRQGI